MAVTRGIGGIKKSSTSFHKIRLTGTIVHVGREFKQASDTAVMMANENSAKIFINYVDHIIPRKTEALAKSVTTKMNNSLSLTVQYKANYAWWQERGYTSGPVKKYTTPGTSAHFVKQGREYLESTFDQYVRKYASELENKLPVINRR